jgi:hypothetical protein
MSDSPGLTIDFDTADRIAVLVLKDYRKLLQKELDDYESGEYLHPEDVAGNVKRIGALDLIIADFSTEW